MDAKDGFGYPGTGGSPALALRSRVPRIVFEPMATGIPAKTPVGKDMSLEVEVNSA